VAASSARAARPETRKAGALYTPTSANFITHDADEYNLIMHQAQRLAKLFSLSEPRAALIASLAFAVRS
jgi:hypothetical protein